MSTEQQGEYPVIDMTGIPTSELPWVKSLKGADRAIFEQAREENIVELIPEVEQVVRDMVPTLETEHPEQFVALVGRYATGLRNYFEVGMQSGLDARDARHEAERSRWHSLEIQRLGGYG